MRLLLDTHVFLWFDQGSSRLRAADRQKLNNLENELFLSSASLWELAIKRSLGRLESAVPFSVSAKRLGVQILPILAEHAEETEKLPRLHGDPFDHMLVAQAKAESLVLVTHDEQMQRYDVPILRV